VGSSRLEGLNAAPTAASSATTTVSVTVGVGMAAVSGLTVTVADSTPPPFQSAVSTYVVTTQMTNPQAGPSAQAVWLRRDGTLVGKELTCTPTAHHLNRKAW
jgi:hypothetical protein